MFDHLQSRKLILILLGLNLPSRAGRGSPLLLDGAACVILQDTGVLPSQMSCARDEVLEMSPFSSLLLQQPMCAG